MKNRTSDVIASKIIGYTILTFFALLCIAPVWLIVVGSFSDNGEIMRNGYSFWVRTFSTKAYETLFKVPKDVLNAYKVSIIVTIVGTLLQLSICSSAGYVLSRKDFKYRNSISFFFFFTTIFSAGLVPWYILCVKYLHFKEHPYIALIVPSLFSYFYVIIIRSFMSGIPASISESAKIDGANDFVIFIKLILPMSKPVLATVGLFGALNYWNDWYNAMLFTTSKEYYPLQFYLYSVLNSAKAIASLGTSINIETMKNLPTETYKLATTIVATGPIVLVYPFIQKYFIKGMTIGAVKG